MGNQIRRAQSGPLNILSQEIIMFESLKTRVTSWKRYNRTMNELNSLSSRELDDLGIARADIGRIARESAR